jgi:hypothetical protein
MSWDVEHLYRLTQRVLHTKTVGSQPQSIQYEKGTYTGKDCLLRGATSEL